MKLVKSKLNKYDSINLTMILHLKRVFFSLIVYRKIKNACFFEFQKLMFVYRDSTTTNRNSSLKSKCGRTFCTLSLGCP